MDYIMGSIVTFGYNWAPMGFAVCDGSVIPIAQNSALYSLLGTTFGGNGSTTFGLPDLRGRVPAGQGRVDGTGGTYTFAAKFGVENKTLSTNEMPAHNHTATLQISEKTSGQTVNFGTAAATSTANNPTATATVNASSAQATVAAPTSSYWARPWNGTASTPGYINTKNVTMASDAVAVTITVPITTTVTMSGQSFNASNLQTAGTIGITGASTPFSLAQPSLVLNHCICTQGIYPSRP